MSNSKFQNLENLEYLDNLIETWQMWHSDTSGRETSCHKWLHINWFSINWNVFMNFHTLVLKSLRGFRRGRFRCKPCELLTVFPTSSSNNGESEFHRGYCGSLWFLPLLRIWCGLHACHLIVDCLLSGDLTEDLRLGWPRGRHTMVTIYGVYGKKSYHRLFFIIW